MKQLTLKQLISDLIHLQTTYKDEEREVTFIYFDRSPIELTIDEIKINHETGKVEIHLENEYQTECKRSKTNDN